VTDWVAKAVVLAIHDQQIAEHGGLSGLRDDTLLESALARPAQLEAYGSPIPDIAALAAALAFGLARNHAFLDGNKRTSSVVAGTFLILNGYDLTADEASRLQIWVGVGEGTVSEEELAKWLRANITKLLD
jgi:death on curing protein